MSFQGSKAADIGVQCMCILQYMLLSKACALQADCMLPLEMRWVQADAL